MIKSRGQTSAHAGNRKENQYNDEKYGNHENRKLRLRAACGLLAVLAAAVLTACGSSGTGGQNGTETASESLETSAPESAAETENDAPGPRETPSPEEIASMKAEEAGTSLRSCRNFLPERSRPSPLKSFSRK